MAEEKNFKIKIICPDRVFYEGEAEMVEFTASEGDIGIYKNHIPLTTAIKPGVLTITDDQGGKKAAVHAGFVEVLGDSVTVLAEIAEWPDEIDVDRAQRAKERAEARLATKEEGIDVLRAEVALKKALVRIGLSGK
ncbi:MAG: ATP synthase F1 subunit epsilon [Lachnospiraceae bacterium]|jgi:F-type H+-transporting ATPase subunit epsilon|nr:ATP synthase F1 subunit epsilon [Lachnospiraceae bacterium]